MIKHITINYQGEPENIPVRLTVPESVYKDAASQDAIKLLLDDPNVSTALKNVLDEDYWKREAREDPDRFMEGWDFGPDPIEQMESEDWDYEDWSRGV